MPENASLKMHVKNETNCGANTDQSKNPNDIWQDKTTNDKDSAQNTIRHTTHDTRHMTHDTRHTTHDTRKHLGKPM